MSFGGDEDDVCAGRHCMGQAHSSIIRVSWVVYIMDIFRGIYMHNASIRYRGGLDLVDLGAAVIFE